MAERILRGRLGVPEESSCSSAVALRQQSCRWQPETGKSRMSVAWRRRTAPWIQAQVRSSIGRRWSVPHAVSTRRFCRGKGPGRLLRHFASSPSRASSSNLPLVGGMAVVLVASVASCCAAEIHCMLLAAMRDLYRFAACSEPFQPALGVPEGHGPDQPPTLKRREAGTLIRGGCGCGLRSGSTHLTLQLSSRQEGKRTDAISQF